MNLVKRDSKFVWHPFTQVKTELPPIPIVKADGVYLYDEDGKKYIDINSSWWVNVHGHNHPEIKAALNQQFSEVDHVVFAGITHPKAVELSEKLLKILKNDFSKVFFSDNGSTAVEVAIKMAMQYWFNKGEKKLKMLALEGAYHGDTFGAMSLGQRGYFNKPFEPFFFDANYLPFPDAKNAEKALEIAENHFKSGDFAALIVEPLVQGSSGMRMYSKDWLNKLVLLAKKYNVLVIFDEVMTGWGRTGELFAMHHCMHSPDIVCLSKGLTAGVLPMGLTVTKEFIFEAFLDEDKTKAFLHGHSYTANALACAVACKNIEIFERKETRENIQRIVKKHQEFKEKHLKHTKIRDLRQCGTILAIEIIQTEASSYFSNIREQALRYFLENGIYLRPLGNVLFLNPPYCITNEELDYCYQHILHFLESLDND